MADPAPRGRVLHVDDDEANRCAVTRSLVRAGFEVVEASSGSEALARLAERAVDIAILDVRLPDINGFEVCRRIKQDPRTTSVPVLHLSASLISGEDRAHGLDGGADAFLVRPVAPVELVATVNALLRVKRAEDDLRAAKSEAEAAREAAETANRVKDEFLATLSHELRTPLTAIIGWASILQRKRSTPAELDEGLKTIERNAKAQAQLIEDLLDVSRIIFGKLRLDARHLRLSTVVKAAIGVIKPLAEARQIRIVREDADADDGMAVLADPNRLQQVFWNLLSNAAKFTPEGGQVTVCTRLVTASDAGGLGGRCVEVTVADTGRGIAPELLPFIFERFRQADVSAARSGGGLGLGLAIVRQLVELHGGTIRAHSDGTDRGATFTVTLPLADGDDCIGEAADSAMTVAGQGDDADGDRLAGLAVLIVEDDADCRILASRILQASGASVVEVADVTAALSEIVARRFDVVVSDIGMPAEDGYDLIRKLRALPADAGGTTPAIALSAFVQASSQQRMLDSGFDEYIAKPVDPHELCAVVERVAKRARR